MKPSAFDHPKTEDFADRLGIRMREAWGILDRLFAITTQHAYRGDVGARFTDRQLARRLDWDESEGVEKLVEALAGAGFLDPHPVHRFVVHDWPEHAPEYVKRKIRESTAGWAVNDRADTGSTPVEPRPLDTGEEPDSDPAKSVPSLPFHTSPLLSSADPEDQPRLDPYRLPPDSPTLTPKQVRDLIATKPNGVVHTEQDIACWYAHKHPQMVARGFTDFARTARNWFPNAKPGEVNESKEWVRMVNARATGERLKAEEALQPPPPEYSREELEALAERLSPRQG
jgi:hypothetical protein